MITFLPVSCVPFLWTEHHKITLIEFGIHESREQMYGLCLFNVIMLAKVAETGRSTWGMVLVDTCKINFIMNEVNERRRLKGAKRCVCVVCCRCTTRMSILKVLKYIKNDGTILYIFHAYHLLA